MSRFTDESAGARKLAAAFRRAGFELENTGGGCSAWVRYQDDKAIVATDALDGGEPPDSFDCPVNEGIYIAAEWGDGGHPLKMNDYDSARDYLSRRI